MDGNKFMLKKNVIDYFGGTVATATVLNISKSTVSLWEEVVPWKYALLIEKLTKKNLMLEVDLYQNKTIKTLKNNSL
ncbi:Cro/CI family transcriptional regulator [Candidatus Arsenophonus triatominarum]|uniref:Cro/CI family transcriptional regulator n=1 Tax=Candidatus Arsenophonus triatominarum TaxID=57911 RepID=UPI001FE1927C|nr:Cro/CI family transcriptional regulator [Candidatus Arsenophonus triatominarum]